jgi:N-acetyl-gamma-glutamyl-phosphate reductase
MIKVCVVGASGYSGAELVRLLSQHPEVRISCITSATYQTRRFSEIYPNLLGIVDMRFTAYSADEAATKSDVVFVALPHGASMKYVPQLVEEKKCKVIDLSGDFRFADRSIYEEWYQMAHMAPQLLGQAVYGLSEINREKISGADFVSNPGCFPTAVILATAPLLANRLIQEEDVVVDSLTGVSGAGRVPSDEVHFAIRDENVNAYKVGGVHQHIPEMEQEMSRIAGVEVKVSFTPQLSPFSRGIYSVINARLKEEVETATLIDAFRGFYQTSFFVQILDEGQYPQLKAVKGANFCHIGIKVDQRTGRVVVVSAIDNLIKGAAGQAIQNMNLMFGLDETTGLRAPGLYP